MYMQEICDDEIRRIGTENIFKIKCCTCPYLKDNTSSIIRCQDLIKTVKDMQRKRDESAILLGNIR